MMTGDLETEGTLHPFSSPFAFDLLLPLLPLPLLPFASMSLLGLLLPLAVEGELEALALLSPFSSALILDASAMRLSTVIPPDLELLFLRLFLSGMRSRKPEKTVESSFIMVSFCASLTGSDLVEISGSDDGTCVGDSACDTSATDDVDNDESSDSENSFCDSLEPSTSVLK